MSALAVAGELARQSDPRILNRILQEQYYLGDTTEKMIRIYPRTGSSYKTFLYSIYTSTSDLHHKSQLFQKVLYDQGYKIGSGNRKSLYELINLLVITRTLRRIALCFLSCAPTLESLDGNKSFKGNRL